jgi:hypothetical protein
MRLLLVLSCLTFPRKVNTEFVPDTEPVETREIFDLISSNISTVKESDTDVTYYYCIFRSLWTATDHPNQYPDRPRFTPPMLFSHTKQYAPFVQNREASYAVENYAEHGITTLYQKEMNETNGMVRDYVEGVGFYLNQRHLDANYIFLDPIRVDSKHTYVSGISSFDPSPDWFTGFYMMNTLDVITGRYWERFMLKSYPWDAGTDDGMTYKENLPRDRPEAVHRMHAGTAPNGVFTKHHSEHQNGTIAPTAEWECILHSCPIEESDCTKEDWPPKYNCDILKYPNCDQQCDPRVEQPCEQCIPESLMDPKDLHYPDCCAMGREPKKGRCTESAAPAFGRVSVLFAITLVSWIIISQ